MITSARMEFLTTATAAELTATLKRCGYKSDKVDTANFLGMTAGNQFCYACTYTEDNEVQHVKVFLTLNIAKDLITADY
jgi:hypothetical protein